MSASLRFLATMLLLVFSNLSYTTDAQLTSNFYVSTCPRALPTIRTAVNAAISKERRMAASLIRLHFHDCFVQGCDGSVLLDDAAANNITSEKNALQNFRSVRGFEVINDIKSKVEAVCPGVVSCADILAVAARDASAYVSGPTWTVKLGRRDSRTANTTLAENDLPLATDNLDRIIGLFQAKGLNEREMIALSGAHTIGQAACVTFRNRLYNNDTNIEVNFRNERRRRCPLDEGNGNLAPLDLVTPNSFDNNYYKNLMQKKGLLHSDQVLFNNGSADSVVREYSNNRARFYADFVAAMVKMGDIEPLTGTAGEIRKTPNIINSA